jgi:hypothetical protein
LKEDEKTLKSIRDYAFTHQSAKVKENATHASVAGWIRPICEMMEEEIRIKNVPLVQKVETPTEADRHA